MTDNERLHRYVEGFFQKSGNTTFPTVAQVAKALKWKQKRVEEVANGDLDGNIFISEYFTAPAAKLGEKIVETCEIS